LKAKAKYLIAAAIILAVGIFVYTRSGYTYNKNDLVIPSGVTCQQEVRSWISEGSGGMPAVLSDLKSVKADLDNRQASAANSDASDLIKAEGNLSQNMPPGCFSLSYYDTVNPVDTAITQEQETLYDMRAGKDLPLADRDFSSAIAEITRTMDRLTAYAK
jgi:hypothetical protein